MYEFLERLIKMSLPRIRDFRGVSTKAFDGNGNYTLGVSDQSIFPEIELDKIKRNIGFDITIVTTARIERGSQIAPERTWHALRRQGQETAVRKTEEQPEEAAERVRLTTAMSK